MVFSSVIKLVSDDDPLALRVQAVNLDRHPSNVPTDSWPIAELGKKRDRNKGRGHDHDKTRLSIL
jgi:hypothetical protein